MTKRPTIRDVAERAGVSKSLVANVFSGAETVSPKRRDAVLEAAQELGYTPNAWARTLRSANGGFVGIIVADLHNPLFTEIADAVRQSLAARDVFSFVSTASIVEGPDGSAIDPAPIRHLLDLKPSSVLIVGGLPDHGPFRSLPEELPIVVALARATDLPTAVTIRTDDDAAMIQLCEHLRSLGHRSIAYLGPEGRSVSDGRRVAFRKAATATGLDATLATTGTSFDEASGLSSATDLLTASPRPTAIVCFNDNIAFGAQSAVLRATTTGEPDVAVTGFDNTYIAQLDRVALTSIEQNVPEIVRLACDALDDRDRFAEISGTEILVAPRLVLRGSTESVRISS